jgi:hypothetical protein
MPVFILLHLQWDVNPGMMPKTKEKKEKLGCSSFLETLQISSVC